MYPILREDNMGLPHPYSGGEKEGEAFGKDFLGEVIFNLIGIR